MFGLVRVAVCNATKLISTASNIGRASFHLLNKPLANNYTFNTSTLLAPKVYNIVPICGFKVKGRLRRRCKDCYFVRREERLFIICKTHPRHKQMSMVKDPKNTWILSHATQCKVRPW